MGTDEEFSGVGMYGKAGVFEEQGDRDSAKATWQELIDSGPAWAAMEGKAHMAALLEDEPAWIGGRIAFEIALTLEDSGDRTGAIQSYQRALRSGHPDVVDEARKKLKALQGRGK